MRADDLRGDWMEYQRIQSERAEEECNGNLYRNDLRFPGRFELFRQLWLAPPQNACKVATEELLEWWRINGRLTFAEYVYQAGVRNRKISKRARTAPYTTADAINQNIEARRRRTWRWA